MSIFKEVVGQGQDIVILHGWSCNHRMMQPVVNQLSARYRITAVDLPGTGQSDWAPETQSIHDIADQLLPELPAHAIYIGWSFGGLTSISIAARYPERVKRFIGITTTPKFVSGENWPAVPQPGFKKPFNEGMKDQDFKSFLQAYYDSEFECFKPKPKAYYELMELLDDMAKMDLEVLYKGIDICDQSDLREEGSIAEFVGKYRQ